MTIVIDTNIVISAIISDKGKIGNLLFNTPENLKFLSPSFLLEELDIHKEKIKLLTGYDEEEFEHVRQLTINNIEFVKTDKITQVNWLKSIALLKDIDEKDAAFIALCLDLNCSLWTGDKRLIKGLENKNFNNIVTTNLLYTKYFG